MKYVVKNDAADYVTDAFLVPYGLDFGLSRYQKNAARFESLEAAREVLAAIGDDRYRVVRLGPK